MPTYTRPTPVATSVNTEADENVADPDNPKDDRGFTGVLTITAKVNITTGSVFPSYGTETDARIVERARKYATKAGDYQYDIWYLEAEAQDVKFSDGNPATRSQAIKLQSKDGKNLGKNMTHAKVAEQFNSFGTSASYVKAGQEGTALGRMFEFGSETVKLGKSFSSDVQLWPKAIFDEGAVFEGEVRVITPKADDNAAPTDGGTSNALAEAEVIAILAEVLNGRRPAEMLDVVLGDARLSGVSTVFGVPLLESATDESLSAVLVENKAMALSGGGVLQAV